MPGDLCWRLGAHLEPKGVIFVILETFPGQTPIPFEIIFQHFLAAFVYCFLVCVFLRFFEILGARSIQNGRHLEVMLRSFWGTGDFLIFHTPLIRNPIF